MRRTSRCRVAGLAAACGLLAGGVHACKAPTQVTVEIGTLGFPCSDLKRVTIVVGADPDGVEQKAKDRYVTAEETRCLDDHTVGTIVLTPAQDRGAVMVLGSYSDARCEWPRYEGCIVARRAFAFIQNVSLRLPVTLEASCKDVPCNALTSCRSGQCVSSQTDCHDDGTCTSAAQPAVDGQGRPIPPDAEAVVDAGPPNDGATPADVVVPPPVDAGDGGARDATTTGDPGNICPVPGAPQDCTPAEGAGFGCCGNGGTWACDQAADCPTMFFECTGRLHCQAADYCCASMPTPDAGFQSYSSCATTCTSGYYFCNTGADCPPSKPSCTGSGPTQGGVTLHTCE